MSDITFFGETTFRNTRRKFGIKRDDRRRHFYTVGKTGMGKTVLLENMAIQDIQSGEGMGFIDPHGEASDNLLNFVPADRIKDVVYINPADMEYPIAFNVMEEVDPEHRHLVASGLMSVFKKIWPDVWSARMEYILNNTILALLEYPGSTLLGVNRMLSDPSYREEVVSKVQDPMIKAFWTQEFARYTQRFEVEATAAIQNKVGQFISNPLIRNIVGQSESSIDMREIMDGQKILIVNISKGRVGEDNSRLLGALITTKLQLAAMSRVHMPEEKRKDFFLYIDEFQNFATESFINILSEARKYRLALTLSHQYVEQLEDGVKEAVFGNVGTLLSFRVGAEDAEFLEKEFSPEFYAQDFVNLGKYNMYVKLMIDGLSGRPFSAEGLAPFPQTAESNKDAIIAYSREKYSTPLAVVEKKIASWSEAMDVRSDAASAVASNPSFKPQQQLYDAKCATCGKDTKVVFEPDGKRPVYCKSCRKKQQAAKEQNNKEKESKKSESVSLSDAMDGKPTFFHPNSRKSRENLRPQKKEVNKSELREVLRESLEKKNTPKEGEDVRRGSLGPGETVYL
ncbi:MAG: type IV secretion system DNA-binding domain-containing protein [Patescibacteria group bacterium]|nr:type IV secretion system DNA-binding domain-containing protein [Patescibacteria group bacterium]